MEPDAVEIRVVGCLIEKQRTTPDAYPLSLNALRLACNQSTDRDPVVDYDEAAVGDALRRLALRGWTRLASGAGSRARKYRHLIPEALGVDEGGIALLGVLMLRGAADAGRAEAAQRTLAPLRRPGRRRDGAGALIERGYVVRRERRPGQKELQLFAALGGGGEADAAAAPEPAAPAGPSRRRGGPPKPGARGPSTEARG